MKSCASKLTIVSVLIALVGLASGCAGSKKSAPLVRETTVVTLPPLPQTVKAEAYCVDTPLSVRCAEVPSGMLNCTDILSREARQQIAVLLGETVDATWRSTITPGAEGTGASGDFTESRMYLLNSAARVTGFLGFRRHESPIFLLADGRTYAMRTCITKEDADFLLYTEIADRAAQDSRPVLANTFRDLRARRYRSGSPDHDRVAASERAITAHFEDMWNMALERKESNR